MENTFQLTPEQEAMMETLLNEEQDVIPKNSGSLEVDETTVRFSSAIWYEAIQKETVILAGLGGIGSYVHFLLSRLKPDKIYLFDDDRVDTSNMSGQLYTLADVGSKKTQASISKGVSYSSYYSYVENGEYTNTSITTDVMICGFDNMKARSLFYYKWKTHTLIRAENKKNCLFIDGRLAAEEFQVFAIQGNDDRAMKEYEEKYLFPDREAEETVCSYKQTSFMANMIASVMVNIFVNFIANKCNPIIDRDVPFFTSYNAITMFTKTVM